MKAAAIIALVLAVLAGVCEFVGPLKPAAMPLLIGAVIVLSISQMGIRV